MDSYIDYITEKMNREVSKKVDDMIIEGIARKIGKTEDIKKVVETRCTCVRVFGVSYYYLDGKAFLMHSTSKIKVEFSDGKLSVDAGEFSFL